MACLHYFRFQRSFSFIATEVGYFSADFMAIEPKTNRFIEVEIKTTKQDLIADFKKRKHDLYLRKGDNESFRGSSWVPREFFFAVPSYLEEYATNVIEDMPYGLMIYTHHETRFQYGRKN